jgi:hypothetical protein
MIETMLGCALYLVPGRGYHEEHDHTYRQRSIKGKAITRG